jgi:hypothetical protein
METEARGRKSIFYLGGLTEGAETIALFILISVWPDYFEWMAWGFGALCWATTAGRVASAVAAFRRKEPPEPGPADKSRET